MSVHYKFKSSKDFDTVTFDGLHISIGELKKNIIQQKKIGKTADYELQITNAQTKEIYDNDDILVPKNTSVLVSRIPIVGANKKNWHRETSDADALLDAQVAASSAEVHGAADTLKVADIAASSASEEDKIKAMISQSSQEFDSSKFVKKPFVGPPPPSYICFKCMKPGHWIQKCPHPPADKTAPRVEVKRSTGIPRSFMVTVDDPTHKGVMLSTNGELVIPTLDARAYQEKKIEKPPFVPDLEEKPVVVEKTLIPEDLQCMICKELLTDAVLIPCCGTCFCDECIRSALLDSDHHECPVCHELDQTPDKLIPNRFLRSKVSRLKNGIQKKKAEIESTVPRDIKEEPIISSPIISDQEKPAVEADQPKKVTNEEHQKPLLEAPKDVEPKTSPNSSISRSRSPEELNKENDEERIHEHREKVEVVGTDREREFRDDRFPPRWRNEDGRGEPRNFERERRRYDRSPPRFRRYQDFSPHRRGPPREHMMDPGAYQPLNPPPMPFHQFSLPPPGYPPQPPGQQPPPPGLGAPMMPAYPVGYPPMGMMPVPMGIAPNNQAEREALEEFERKLSEMRHSRRRRSPSPLRRRRYSRSRSRSYSPRGNARRRSRSTSRDRIRARPRRRSNSRSPYGRSSYRSSSRERKRERFRNASPQEYTRPLQTNSRKYRDRSQERVRSASGSPATETEPSSRVLSPVKSSEPSSSEKKKKKKRKTKSGDEESVDKKKKKKKHKRNKDVQEADTTQPEKEDREGSVPVVAKIEDSIEEGKTTEENDEFQPINSPESRNRSESSRAKSNERTPILDQDSIATANSSSTKSPDRPLVEKSKWERSSSSERESTPVPPGVPSSRIEKSKITSEVIQKAEVAMSSKPPRIQPPPSSGVSSKIISLKPIKSRLGEQLKEKDVFKDHHRDQQPRAKPDNNNSIQVTIQNEKPKRQLIRAPSPSPIRETKTKLKKQVVEEKDESRKEISPIERKPASRTRTETREIHRDERRRDDRTDRSDRGDRGAERVERGERSDRRKSPTREKVRDTREAGGRTLSRRSRSRDRERRERSRSPERRERDRLREQEELLRKERKRRKELERELEKQKRLEAEIERERQKREQYEKELQKTRRDTKEESSSKSDSSRKQKKRHRTPSPSETRDRSRKRSRSNHKDSRTISETSRSNRSSHSDFKPPGVEAHSLPVNSVSSSSLTGHDLDLSFEPDYDLEVELPDRN